jgi:hypothetical protein
MGRAFLLLAGLCVAALPTISAAAESVGPIGKEIVAVAQEGGFEPMAVAGDGLGGFVVAWEDGGIQALRLDPSGTVGAPFRANLSTVEDHCCPSVAMRPSGDFVVIWKRFPPGQTAPSYLFARLFDPSGAPRGPEFLVNSFTDLAGYRSSPAVSMDQSGRFVVVWEDYEPGEFFGIFARRFGDAGEPLGDEFQVNTYTTGTQYNPVVAAAPAGHFVVAWTNGSAFEDDVKGIAARSFDAAGAPLGAEGLVSASPAEHQFAPTLGADASGGFVIAWNAVDVQAPDPADDSILARRLGDDGTPVASEFRVDTNEEQDEGSVPRVAVDVGSGFAVAWNYRGLPYMDVGVRAFEPTSLPTGPVFQVNARKQGWQLYPTIAASGGEFLTVWSDPRGLVARRVGPPRVTAKLKVSDRADPEKRALSIKPAGRIPRAAFGRRVDPIADGAYLHVYNADGTGDSVCLPLPAEHWRSKEPDAGRFDYTDRANAAGPCARLTIANRKVVKARCNAKRQPLDYSLDEPRQGTVVVRFVSGSAAYCSLYGSDVRVDRTGSFGAVNVLPASDCPPPATPCP